nr:MAG TPA: hypothetical protein [Caudoviricetes sp.]
MYQIIFAKEVKFVMINTIAIAFYFLGRIVILLCILMAIERIKNRDNIKDIIREFSIAFLIILYIWSGNIPT